MEAEQVVEKILADAKSEAEKIAKQGREKETAEQVKADEQLAEYKKQTKILAENSAKNKKSYLLAAARMDIAKENLAKKRVILDEVFDLAKTQLQNLPDDEYRDLMAKLMCEAVETGDEQVVVGQGDSRIDQGLIEQVNSKLRSDNKGNLKLSDEKQNMAGGFILKRGKVKTNVSLEIMLSQARKQLEIGLAKELFEN